ncbi:hypothetical protein ACFL0H_15055 [Thermodesulfobacteriota bacterium]
MTDLTLNEYRGVPEERLEQILSEEAKMIYSADSGRIIIKGKTGSYFRFLKYLKILSRRHPLSFNRP